jgi:hypothetical protein
MNTIFSEGTTVKNRFLMTNCHHRIEVMSLFAADDKLTLTLNNTAIVPVENCEAIKW